MTQIVKDVNETIGLKVTVSGTLTPVRCRNCKRELAPHANFEYCNDCSMCTMWASGIYSSSP
jgi:hypothetical protein